MYTAATITNNDHNNEVHYHISVTMNFIDEYNFRNPNSITST